MKKYIGISLLVIGIVGFFYFTNQKNNKRVFNESISGNQMQAFHLTLRSGELYEIKFWGVDEEMTSVYQAPHFEAQIKVLGENGKLLFNRSLVSIHEIETGGKRVTHDGISFEYTAISNEEIEIQTQIKDGDYLDIEVYKNLNSESDALPGLSIILALMGLILFWKNRVRSKIQ